MNILQLLIYQNIYLKIKLKQLSNMDKNKALEIVAGTKIKPDSERNKIFLELQKQIKEKTNNFTKVDGLSSEKFDMETVLEEERLDKKMYLSMFGSFNRSEIDVLSNLANEIKEFVVETKNKIAGMFKFKMKMLEQQLKLSKLKLVTQV